MNRINDTGDRSREQGMATLVAVACLLAVLTLTTAAIAQSVGSLSSFAQGRKLLQTVDASEAGIQAEISSLESWLAAPTLTVPCPAGTQTPGLPSGGWIPAGSSSSDSVVNAASLGYYSLSVTTSTTEPAGQPAALPASSACYGRTVLAPVGASSWYLLVQSKGVSSATTGGSTATGRTLQALLLVDQPSLAAHHRPGHPGGPSPGRMELVGYFTTSTSTYTSSASAQAIDFSPLTFTASTASYSGSGPPDANVDSSNQPSIAPLTGESWLTLGALGQYAEADSSGSSVACAGLVASPGTVPAGSVDPSCTPSGSPGPTGVKLDLSTIPGVGSLLSPIADVTLETSAITATASMGTGGAPASGSATLGSMYVRVAVPLGPTVTIPLTFSSAPNQDLLNAITSAISGDSTAIGLVTPTLVSTLQTAFTITSNYQSTSGGQFEVSAMHLTIPSAGITADLAETTVGPNTFTSAPPPTTVPPTTVPPTTTTAPPTTTTLPSNDLTIVWIKQVA